MVKEKDLKKAKEILTKKNLIKKYHLKNLDDKNLESLSQNYKIQEDYMIENVQEICEKAFMAIETAKKSFDELWYLNRSRMFLDQEICRRKNLN